MIKIEIPGKQTEQETEATSIASSLLHLSLPLVLRGFFLSVVQFLWKRSILAQKDESLLAAYGGFSAIEGFIFILLFSSLRIISAKTALIYESAKEPEKVGDVYREGLVFGGLLMIPALTLSVSAKSIFEYMQQPRIVIDDSRQYFSIGMVAYFFDMLYRVQSRITVGTTDTTLALMGDGIESTIDLIVTYVLVNGKWGFPEMGVIAASWGYAIGAIAAWIFSTLYLKFSPHYQKYQLFNFSRSIQWQELKSMITSGMHLAFGDLLIDVSQMLLTFSCGLSGAPALIGLQAASTYGYLAALPGDGILEAASVLIGKYYQKDKTRFHQVSNIAFSITVGFALVSAAFLYSNTAYVTDFFMPREKALPENYEMVQSFLRVQACMDIVNSMKNFGEAMLLGGQETRFPFMLNAAFIFVLNSLLIAAVYFKFNAGPVAAFGIQLVGLILVAAGVGARWKKELYQSDFWKKQEMLQESPRRLNPNELLCLES